LPISPILSPGCDKIRPAGLLALLRARR